MVSVVDVLAFWQHTDHPNTHHDYDHQINMARTLVIQSQAGNPQAAAELGAIAIHMESTPET